MNLKEYIKANWKSINWIKVFELYSQEQLREDAEESIITVIKEIKEEEKEEGKPITRWCQAILDNSNKFFRSDVTATYWIKRTQAFIELKQAVYDTENQLLQNEIAQSRKRKALRELKNIIDNMDTPNETGKHSIHLSKNNVEGDKILFGKTSPGTIIKNYAESKLPSYKSLSDDEKLAVGLSANGILDLSNNEEVSQRMLFVDNEWDLILSKYSKVSKLHKKKELTEVLKNINKHLDSLEIKKAYTKARNLECKHFDTPNEWIYATYAHILKVYRKRSAILNKNETNSTEYDAFSKLWSEIIEDVFGSKTRIVKWGESIGESTKEEMDHAGITKKIKEYKVDCRVLTLIEGKEHDLLNCEAARYITEQKVLDGKLKLLLKTRSNLDHLIACCPNANPHNLRMNYLQICGNKMDVGCLRLVDQGLYITETIGDLSIPINISDFKDNSVEWFSLLGSLLSNVTKLETLACEMEVDKRGSFNDVFRNDNDSFSFNKYVLWLRGYFFPPSNKDDPVIYPQNMYFSPIRFADAIGTNKQKKQKISPSKKGKQPSYE